MSITIDRADSADDIGIVRELFEEYAGTLDFSLESQNFAAELEALPGSYAAPAGCLLMARVSGEAAAVVAFKSLGDGTCEMKRLFVRPQYRGHGIGLALTERLIDEARAAGYSAMRLDTIPSLMAPAVALYERLGFTRVPAYWNNVLDGVEYMELKL